MGKTKTAFLTDSPKEEKSGKEAYEEKRKRKEEAEARQKAQVAGVGLKGGERIKVITGDVIETETAEETKKSKKSKKAKVRSKNYKTAYQMIDKSKLYPVDNAIKLLKEMSKVKFDASIELHLLIKKENFSTDVALPYSSGKTRRVAFADDELITKLKSGKVDFDVLLATADYMPKLMPFARLLGPKGLMPNPKKGTIIKSKKEADKFSGNNIEVKTEKNQPVIHTVVGKISQKEDELKANIEVVLDSVNKKQILKAFLSSTMSPSVKLVL